ncbi:MAG: hypothetical protein RL038_903 [Actinomycetota bacterium]|jgi:hypothetical protein
MESLALFVGLLLLGLFIGGPVALAISFIPTRWAKILAIVLAAPITGLGIMLALSADGGANLWLIGFGSSAFATGAIVNSIRGLKQVPAPEFETPTFEEPQ